MSETTMRVRNLELTLTKAQRVRSQEAVASVSDVYATAHNKFGRATDEQRLYLLERVVTGHALNLRACVALHVTVAAQKFLDTPPASPTQPLTGDPQ